MRLSPVLSISSPSHSHSHTHSHHALSAPPQRLFCRPAEQVSPDLVGQHHDFGIEMVQALDAAHAQDIARAQHPTGRLSAVPAELLDGQDRHKLLAAWLRGEG
jgi:hypothetical protein